MDLLQQAKNGDREALEELYMNSVPACLFICKMLLKNSSESENVCRDIYSRVFSRLDRMDDRTVFSEWMKNAAAVACASILRRNNGDIFLEDRYEKTAETLFVPKGSALNAQETAKAVENCFDSMPLPERFSALCYYFNGMTIPQIAAVMDVPQTRVKELLRRGHTALSSMVNRFNKRGIKTTEITLKPVLELSAAMLPLPEGLKFSRLDTSEYSEKGATAHEADKSRVGEDAQGNETAPAKKATFWEIFRKSGRQGFTLAAVCGILVLLCIAGVFAVASKRSPESTESANSVSGVSAVSSVLSQATSSETATSSAVQTVSSKAAVSQKATTSKKSTASFIVAKTPTAAPYLITENTGYNENGEKEKTEYFTYKGKVLSSAKTVTDLMNETLYYSWNDKHTVRTTKSGGQTIETAQYDLNGNPVKITYKDKKTTTYKWSYTFTKGGYIHTASYKSARSGKYTYSYNEDNRIKKLTQKEGGDTTVTQYSYNEDGTVKSLIKTDFDGEKTTYTYEYDLEKLTFRVTGSDGTLQTGKMMKATDS